MDCRHVGALIAFLFHGPAARADPNALWNIVHGQCVPDWQQHRVLKPPCVAVDLKGGVAGGIAVIKDQRGQTQFLLLPTQRITGIESGALLALHATNYFADAWRERRLVEKALRHAMPRDTLSLAINSELARSRTSCIFTSTAFAPISAMNCGASGPKSASAGSRCLFCSPVIAIAPCA